MPRALIVDDEVPFRKMLSSLLTSLGWRCSLSSCAKEALTLLQNERFDVVITDYNMPGCDGIQLISGLRRGEITLPAILMSGDISAVRLALTERLTPLLYCQSLLAHRS